MKLFDAFLLENQKLIKSRNTDKNENKKSYL